MRALRFITIAAAGAALAGAALAASPSIVVPIDQSTRLNVPGSASSVLVGNPLVADVTVVDSRTLYVSGRGYGSTDVVVLDQFGGALFRGSVVVTAPDVGRVSVYRGGARTDLACAPGCQVANRPSGGDAAKPAGAP
jgi:Flp pilus assembly secretin CpaC